MSSNKLSTTALAKKRSLESKILFNELSDAGYINRFEDKWVLTQLGSKFGGEYFEHPKYGPYIVWPNNLLIESPASKQDNLSPTEIGKKFDLNAKKINQLLSELGWISKHTKNWTVTITGAANGGVQEENKSSSTQYVLWHPHILQNKHLKQSVIEFLGQDASGQATDKSISSFRQKFEAKHRTLDGHYVRTIGELRIDNWLYMNGIPHAYQRLLPIAETLISGFYLPTGNVYLQYCEEDRSAHQTMTNSEVKNLYVKNHLNLIEIMEEDIEELDDILPKNLREYGIQSY
ncbi:glycerol kinase [Vibrio sp. 10N.261.55.A7]|uniref:glycerol kinase n=1 Tax=Vibrio sp. 10N.261.55.A7 TaxID=1880851 RepID=UPI000C85A327|nr:glycerol kinase [Vibrio sp. 10N.261.55.A7]PMJ99866.1 glycerol kinase [Vibrio sp. 10N.261.55.A7]